MDQREIREIQKRCKELSVDFNNKYRQLIPCYCAYDLLGKGKLLFAGWVEYICVAISINSSERICHISIKQLRKDEDNIYTLPLNQTESSNGRHTFQRKYLIERLPSEFVEILFKRRLFYENQEYNSIECKKDAGQNLARLILACKKDLTACQAHHDDEIKQNEKHWNLKPLPEKAHEIMHDPSIEDGIKENFKTFFDRITMPDSPKEKVSRFSGEETVFTILYLKKILNLTYDEIDKHSKAFNLPSRKSCQRFISGYPCFEDYYRFITTKR